MARAKKEISDRELISKRLKLLASQCGWCDCGGYAKLCAGCEDRWSEMKSLGEILYV